MKKAAFILAFLALLSGTSCMLTEAHDSGPMRKVSRQVPVFSGVNAEGAFDITLTQGDANTLFVEAGSKVLDKIKTEVKDGVLEISSEGNLSTDSAMRISIVLSTLKSLDCGGACRVHGAGIFKTDHLRLEVSGAGQTDLDTEVEKLEINLSGAAKLHLTGKTSELEATLDGASQLKAFHFKSDKAVLSLSGASNADVNVKKDLRGRASGASSLIYAGSPEHESVESSGASSIQKANNEE
ncbi:MAG TPA: head GIN domain-containing protein [Bacteroidia bacterium]|jgi:hypothetical protein|nr:head GIN domain-containing protein [Bacteroidia bacterium]